MFRPGDDLVYRYAATADDFAQIHRLNHRTFVEEIPQHTGDGTGLLVDKFHEKNCYLIALKQNRVVGMLSAHDQPPFSVADRLPDPSILVESNVRPVEIRLLAVEPSERNSPVIMGLVWELYQHARAGGYTHFIISGVLEQQKFYAHLGFEPLGPPVGDVAKFVPMWLPLAKLEVTMGRVIEILSRRQHRTTTGATT